jgi:predicted TIM-barrel enzyme
MVELVRPLSRSRHQILAALPELEGSLIDGRFRLELEAATGMSYQLEVDIVAQIRLQ